MKKLAMVIVNYNDYEKTIKLINNVKDYNCLDLIVIVDNKSTDSSVETIKLVCNDKIHLVINEENKGYASGLNKGAKYAHEILKNCNIIFSNSDIVIEKEEDFKTLSDDISEDLAVVGPIVVEGNKYNRGWKKASIAKEILVNIPLISRYIKKTLSYSDQHYNYELSKVDVVSGCLFVVDGDILREIDYFDEKTFLYYEELILGTKLETVDKYFVIDNRVKVIHEHSVTVDKNIAKVKKQKILKESQKYYVKEYLKANKFQLFLLAVTRCLGLISIYIRGIVRR